ncbi:MAG: hypothetical protein JNJ88_04270 [Planctomycetes bacterium]|nr:hypothetical protein [Planctomycetota bacterium]
MPKYRRRQKLPKKALQLRLTLTFVGLAALGMLLQAILFQMLLAQTANELPTDGGLLMERANGIWLTVFGATTVCFLPIVFVVGVFSTFRFAGPIRRFEIYLTSLLNRQATEAVRLRKGDQLEDFAELLNEATAPLREQINQDTAHRRAGTQQPHPDAALPASEQRSEASP